jgi:hypothetical protein
MAKHVFAPRPDLHLYLSEQAGEAIPVTAVIWDDEAAGTNTEFSYLIVRDGGRVPARIAIEDVATLTTDPIQD